MKPAITPSHRSAGQVPVCSPVGKSIAHAHATNSRAFRTLRIGYNMWRRNSSAITSYHPRGIPGGMQERQDCGWFGKQPQEFLW